MSSDTNPHEPPPIRAAFSSRLTRLSLVPAQVRHFGGRGWRPSLFALPFLLLGIVPTVGLVARVERDLAAQGASAARVIVYEVRLGQELRVPIEAGTDVFRVVCHAARRSAPSTDSRVVRLLVAAVGERGSRTDELVFSAPGASGRARSSETDLNVGDPLAINVDVHGIGLGELRLKLAAIEGADALLVRIYRRDALHADELLRRTEHVDDRSKQRLARYAGEVDWDDVDDPQEQRSLLGSRWRKVAALNELSQELPAHAIVLSPPKPSLAEPPADPATLTRFDLRGDERAALVVHGGSVQALVDGAPDVEITATVRRRDGSLTTLTGHGQLTIDVPPGVTAGIELALSSPATLAVRALAGAAPELATRSTAWRTTPERPLIVAAGEAATILRLSARAPVLRTSVAPVALALDVDLDLGNGVHARKTLRATVRRSPYDRYPGERVTSAPTEAAVFYLVLPAGATATVTPATTIDLSLGELDPLAPPRPVTATPVDAEGPRVIELGEVEWGGFLARAPTNAALFGAEGKVRLRIAHRLVVIAEPPQRAPTFRVQRPPASRVRVVDQRIFEPSTVTYEVDVPGGGPLILPVRLLSDVPLEAIVRVDGDAPVRKASATSERLTTPRAMHVDHEVRSVIVLGDDLAPGRHTIRFESPPGAELWIHLPWAHLAGSPARPPRWISGVDE